MKQLSRLFIAVLFTAIALTSCKKSSDNSPAGTTMTFKANGTAVTYNACVAVSASVNDVNQTLITGTNLTNGKPGAASMEVNITHDLATLKAGQSYSVTTAPKDGLILFYFINDSDVFTTQPAHPIGTVTITEVTSSTIKGTFSGQLFSEDDFTGDHVLYTIAGGSFTAKRSN
ncbi:hypothetical protein [Mucilaginibacter sp.]|uniref:hypothetical protein n=1 Tax=Mucilaginibacter sp. TaxID=1882438 RepID=UPI0025D6F2EA|nr:hypothetical protein [Mucilaginibacter sp.]